MTRQCKQAIHQLLEAVSNSVVASHGNRIHYFLWRDDSKRTFYADYDSFYLSNLLLICSIAINRETGIRILYRHIHVLCVKSADSCLGLHKFLFILVHG